MFHYLYCKTLLFQRMIAKKIFFTKLYESKVGIKYVLPICDPFFNSSSDPFFLKPEELFFDFDALKDEYTLCGVSVVDSPHLGLMKCIEENGDLYNTEYIKRFERGTIDIRIPHHVTSTQLLNFKNKFAVRKKEVESSSYPPVSVYKVGDRYYIADGKHRAAMCALLNLPVKCVLTECGYIEDSFNNWLLQKMKKRPESYQRNISFFENINNK